MSGFSIRPAQARDAGGIRRLHARVFGSEMTEAEWAWKFDWNPDGRFGTVAVANGEIVGNYAGWGMQFLMGGAPALLYAVGDVATEPSARTLGGRHGVYRTMAGAFYDALAENESARQVMGEPALRVIAHELVTVIKGTVTVDWMPTA